MKRIILLLLFIVPSLCTKAANSYYIFSVKGQVEVNNDGWHKAKKHETIDLQTEFKLFRNSEIVIVDERNGLKFKYNKPTKDIILLKDIIGEAKSQKNSLLLSTIKAVIDSPKKAKIGFKTIGGITLGNGNRIEKDLSDILQMHLFSDKRGNSKYINDSLVLSKVKYEDKSFSYKITNLTNKNLYVNIIAYNHKMKCFSSPFDVLIGNSFKTTDGLYIFVPAHNELLLNQFDFDRCKNVQIFLFGSTEYFENHSLLEIIKSSDKENTKEVCSPFCIYIGINK